MDPATENVMKTIVAQNGISVEVLPSTVARVAKRIMEDAG